MPSLNILLRSTRREGVPKKTSRRKGTDAREERRPLRGNQEEHKVIIRELKTSHEDYADADAEHECQIRFAIHNVADHFDASRTVDTFAHYAVFLLWPLERTDQAIQELRLAQKTDPLSNEVRRSLCYALPSAGRFDEAAANCEKLPDDFPGRSAYFGRARVLQGRTADGIQILEEAFHAGASAGSEVRAFLGYAYARTGRRDDAEKMAIGTNPFNQAVIFAGLGDKQRALEAMERSDAAGPFRAGRQLTFPELAIIRNDPRMKALRKRVGLTN